MHKRSHLKNAEDLLARADDALLCFAALELRFTIEAITYDKLRLYAPRLPAAVLDKWQPPQAIKALVAFEPNANRPFRLRFSKEDADGNATGPWTDFGEHRHMDAAWLRDAYNRLGSHLHLPSPRSEARAKSKGTAHAAKTREDLEEIRKKLDWITASQIDSSFAEVTTLECLVCKKFMARNTATLRTAHELTCLDDACGAVHWCEEGEEDMWTVKLVATDFECMRCKTTIPVENRRLEIGLDFSCPTCGLAHRLESRVWGYSSDLPPDTTPAAGT